MTVGKRRIDRQEFLLLGLVALMLLAIGVGDGFNRIDRWGLDRFLAIHAGERTLPADIVVIDIDQKSLEDLNPVAGSWPWPRAVHAELIDAIAQQRPHAIVFDLLLNEADTFRPESDAIFADAVRRHPQVLLPTLLMADGTGAPAEAFPGALGLSPGARAEPGARLPLLVPLVAPPDAWRGGTINFRVDTDGIGRRYALWSESSGWRIPSHPQRVATLLGWPLPVSEDILLNWYGSIGARYSYGDVFEDLTGGEPEFGEAFTGKIVVIGAAAPGLGDLRPTPLDVSYPGVLVLATAIGNLHDADWLRETPAGSVAYLLLALLVLTWKKRVSPLPIAVALLALTVALAGLEYVLLARQRLVMHMLAPVSAAWVLFVVLALLSWWRERREREQAVTIFGRFLDPRIVSELVSAGDIASAQVPHAREITVLFSDIRGFTTMSERSTPERIVNLLNDYFSRQVAVIFHSQGTLDKFIGDAIMAFWGAPAADEHHAVHAVEAALEMVEVLLQFRAELGADGEHFDVGIGIHTGPAVVGFIGSRDRLDYTAIGDSVNLASRIEGATKGVARILVSEATMQACGDAFEFIDHGIVHVKGREQGVRLYEPHRKHAGRAAAGR